MSKMSDADFKTFSKRIDDLRAIFDKSKPFSEEVATKHGVSAVEVPFQVAGAIVVNALHRIRAIQGPDAVDIEFHALKQIIIEQLFEIFHMDDGQVAS